MVLCRRPIRVFDVDVVGLAGLALIGAAAYLLLIHGVRSDWRAFQDAAQQRTATERTVSGMHAVLRALDADITRIALVSKQAVGTAPRQGDIPAMLAQLADIAQRCGVDLGQVTPQPAVAGNGYWYVDVEVTGRGASGAFIALLDQFALLNQYHSIPRLSVQTDGVNGGTCRLAWTLRLHVLPEEMAAATLAPRPEGRR